MKYKNLCDTSVKDIHQAFVLAFSDYEVKLDITPADFEAFLTRRGFDPSFFAKRVLLQRCYNLLTL